MTYKLSNHDAVASNVASHTFDFHCRLVYIFTCDGNSHGHSFFGQYTPTLNYCHPEARNYQKHLNYAHCKQISQTATSKKPLLSRPRNVLGTAIPGQNTSHLHLGGLEEEFGACGGTVGV